MSVPDNLLALLPNGFEDLLPPEAEQESRAISILMGTFRGHGYSRVKPPMVEFEDSLLAPGPGAALASETFRLMDPVSHGMMGLRSDITAQIARIASSRLANEPRPLRLAYANDVLRTKASQQRTKRQYCQVGCELIGRENKESDTEVAVMALLGLQALDIRGITMDFSMPQLVGKILDVHDVSIPDRQKIHMILEKREEEALETLESGLQDILKALLGACGPAGKVLELLDAIELPEEARADVERLRAVYQGVCVAVREMELPDTQMTIDPVESRGLEYHHGVAFTLFAKNARGELGRGGRYNILFGGLERTQSATGFTLYMDTIRQAMPESESARKLFIPAEEGWKALKRWQAEGWIVVRGTGNNEGRVQCTHEIKDGKIHEI